MDQVADRNALYSLTSGGENEEYCPCTLRRLDPDTLQVTAQSTFDVMPQLYIIGSE
jgi:hypothetical protein